jgi:hypothetical protein
VLPWPPPFSVDKFAMKAAIFGGIRAFGLVGLLLWRGCWNSLRSFVEYGFLSRRF